MSIWSLITHFLNSQETQMINDDGNLLHQQILPHSSQKKGSCYAASQLEFRIMTDMHPWFKDWTKWNT